MAYVTITLNHMRAVKAWTDAQDAHASLDLRNWELEVRCRNRYFRLHPRFYARNADRILYTHELGEHATGFAGWLPYHPLRYDLSDDKLLFKSFAARAGLKVPARWTVDAPQGDYILKRSMGSFGYEIAGPYQAGATPARAAPEQPGPEGARGEPFAEAFIAGEALKVWYWGAQPFFAHRQAWPQVRGDGQSSLQALVAARTARDWQDMQQSPDARVLLDALAYQGWSPADVLPEGETAWLDFRYGRTYEAERLDARPDSALDALPASAGADVRQAGTVVAAELQKRFPVPVLFALDGVLDAQGAVWWLEANSNPVLPPAGYASIFATLFGAERAM